MTWKSSVVVLCSHRDVVSQMALKQGVGEVGGWEGGWVGGWVGGGNESDEEGGRRQGDDDRVTVR